MYKHEYSRRHLLFALLFSFALHGLIVFLLLHLSSDQLIKQFDKKKQPKIRLVSLQRNQTMRQQEKIKKKLVDQQKKVPMPPRIGEQHLQFTTDQKLPLSFSDIVSGYMKSAEKERSLQMSVAKKQGALQKQVQKMLHESYRSKILAKVKKIINAKSRYAHAAKRYFCKAVLSICCDEEGAVVDVAFNAPDALFSCAPTLQKQFVDAIKNEKWLVRPPTSYLDRNGSVTIAIPLDVSISNGFFSYRIIS